VSNPREFWNSFKGAIAQSGISISTDPRLSESDGGRLYAWLRRDEPLESIAFLIAVLDAIDCELIINYKDKNMTRRTVVSSLLSIGNSGIDEELKELGYAYTICSRIVSEPGEKKHVYQDLHCTKEQLKMLGNLIQRQLEMDGELTITNKE
jgi:hypothetical protein